MRKFILLILLAQALLSHGQTTDTLRTKKKEYKYLSIQANLLLQQFISFNSNSSINNNPYIFTYAKNNIQTGNGFNFGTGFQVNQNSSNDGVSSINVENVNVTFRIGYEKKYFQEQRFIPF